MFNTEFNLDDAKRVWFKDGTLDKAERVAEKMLKRGTPIEIVAEDTELSIEQVKQIAQKTKNEQRK